MPLPVRLDSLAKLMDKDDPKVLVVVGAGIAVGATSRPHASWLGLLKHGIAFLVANGRLTPDRGAATSHALDAAFSPFELTSALQHAEAIEQALTRPDHTLLDQWLDTAFRSFTAPANEDSALSALRYLSDQGALLLTTNYDHLLSDATGLKPITWAEHEDLLQLITRRQSGILHIHGHWQKPSSVVLGKSSYDRVVGDDDFQVVLKSLWLEWSWVYVGCGDGLDDPNLRRLLDWGKRWGRAALPHYFLGRDETVQARGPRHDQLPNLINVAYSAHEHLPAILRDLVPIEHTWPFVLVDANFALFRNPKSLLEIPFPSWEEYSVGQVPRFDGSANVSNRLRQYGWAFVFGAASVGKTTLALRIALGSEYRDNPTYYADFATIEEYGNEPSAALRRLSRRPCLIILDNVHYQPELARSLWDQWHRRPGAAKLLFVATRVERSVTTAPSQDLAHFEHHSSNPAVELWPTSDDLVNIAKYLYTRAANDGAAPLRSPPARVSAEWHHRYHGSLGAFCVAVLARLGSLEREDWDLPLEAASNWVREKWLRRVDADTRENLVCLAVFGSQELELQVRREALPHPRKIEQLLRFGLVAKTERGPSGQYQSVHLREPSWGRLILAAEPLPIDEERTLFETASRHPMTALVLNSRLRRAGRFEPIERLWAFIATAPDEVVKQVLDLPLSAVPNLVGAAREGQQPVLAEQFWAALEQEPTTLAGRTRATPLGDLGWFLDTARRYQHDVSAIWDIIESDPGRFAARAWDTPLHFVGSFLDTALRHRRDAPLLWRAIESDPDKLATNLWQTPLHFIAAFLDVAARHKRNVDFLWTAIESDPARFAVHAWEASLAYVAAFMEAAKGHQRNVIPLWEAIERQLGTVAAQAWETPLHFVAGFLETAKRQARNTAPLWKAIESEPERLIARMWETPLGHIARFITVAAEHGRDMAPLWEALETNPEKLGALVAEAPLAQVVAFVEVAHRQRRASNPFWDLIERVQQNAEGMPAGSLEDLIGFDTVARRHGRDVTKLWNIIERDFARLALVARHTPLAQLAVFGRFAPLHIVRIALANVPTAIIKDNEDARTLVGLTLFAARCAQVERDDLKASIVTTLLKRAQPRDFPPGGNTLMNVAWLLRNMGEGDDQFNLPFLETLCVDGWLATLFAKSQCGYLASGLCSLALYLPRTVVDRFYHPGLGQRLELELVDPVGRRPDRLVQAIQLLGCASLCGLRGEAAWFATLPSDALRSLPVEILPHRSEGSFVEHRQWQLWLGLRVATSLTGKMLELPPGVIAQTLTLWRASLAASSLRPASAEHRINREMVAWLEDWAA